MYVLSYCGVCTGVRLLPAGENPIAVRNNNNNNNNNNMNFVPHTFKTVGYFPPRRDRLWDTGSRLARGSWGTSLQ
jgi:hypothetical protein